MQLPNNIKSMLDKFKNDNDNKQIDTDLNNLTKEQLLEVIQEMGKEQEATPVASTQEQPKQEVKPEEVQQPKQEEAKSEVPITKQTTVGYMPDGNTPMNQPMPTGEITEESLMAFSDETMRKYKIDKDLKHINEYEEYLKQNSDKINEILDKATGGVFPRV